MFFVGAVFHLLVPAIAPIIPPQFEANPDLYRPWAGWTSAYMAIHPFLYGVVFAAGFLSLRRWSTFPPGVRGGLLYGAGVFVVGSLPVYVLNFASFQVSVEMILSWIVQGMTQYVVAGIALGYVCDRGTEDEKG